MGNDGTGVDLGGIDGCFGLDGGGGDRRLWRDISRAVSIADGGTGGLDDFNFAVASSGLSLAG